MKKVLSIIGAMLLTMSLNAQTTLKILPFSIDPGETKVVTLDLDNYDFEAASFKCDIVLPEGLEIEKNARGKYNLSFNAEADRTSLEYHSLSSQVQQDGSVRIVCYSASADVFMGNSGAILNVPIVASSTVSGKGEVQVTNQEVTDATGMIAVKPATYSAEVTMGPTGIEEVNGEGSLADGKYVKNGQIVIKKGDKEYTTVGTISK